MRGVPRYTLVWGARYTLGARYLSKNTVTFFTVCQAVGKLFVRAGAVILRSDFIRTALLVKALRY